MNPSSKNLRRALVALAPLALLGLYACDLLESAQADKVLAATVLAVPSKDFSNMLQVPGDAGVPGEGVDLGDAGWASVPGQTVAQVFFGDRDPANPGKPPSGVTGAKVRLKIGGRSYDLEEGGSGNYSLSTIKAPDFNYVPKAEVVLTIESDGESYTATATAPDEERIAEFNANPPLPIDAEANRAVTLTRASVENVAFTTVMPASQQGKGSPTYSDMPSTPMDLLDLVANDGRWKTPTIEIPASAFPNPDTYYLVNVSAVAKGTSSNNLFTASVLMIGTADLGLVKTR